jgi:hypothetical protein
MPRSISFCHASQARISSFGSGTFAVRRSLHNRFGNDTYPKKEHSHAGKP